MATSPAHVLILGGTSWLGGEVARYAISEGHDVTCLARGESGGVPEGAHLVRADRSTPDGYAVLPTSQRWDLVVDVTRQPGHARGALQALSERADHWVFVSSCSVYARHDVVGADEGADLLPPLDADEGTPEQYGEAKVACEAACTAYRGDDVLIARSGLIVGGGDLSDRFGYWPGRFALAGEDGGPVLVPERLDRPAQQVDVLDLARWLVTAGLAGTTGTYNASGPIRTLGDVLASAREVAGFEGETVPFPDEALVAAGIEEYMGPRSLALWLHDPDWLGFSARDTSAAQRVGLAFREGADTLRDALAWERERGLERTGRRAGLDRADELGLIAARRGPDPPAPVGRP